MSGQLAIRLFTQEISARERFAGTALSGMLEARKFQTSGLNMQYVGCVCVCVIV